MENKKIKIGLIGLGTVGSGVFKTLSDFENVEVVKIAVKNKNKQRNIPNLDESIVTDNAYEVVNNPEIDIVVELIGGTNPAFDLIKQLLKTANISLLQIKNFLQNMVKNCSILQNNITKSFYMKLPLQVVSQLLCQSKQFWQGIKSTKLKLS